MHENKVLAMKMIAMIAITMAWNDVQSNARICPHKPSHSNDVIQMKYDGEEHNTNGSHTLVIHSTVKAS